MGQGMRCNVMRNVGARMLENESSWGAVEEAMYEWVASEIAAHHYFAPFSNKLETDCRCLAGAGYLRRQ